MPFLAFAKKITIPGILEVAIVASIALHLLASYHTTLFRNSIPRDTLFDWALLGRAFTHCTAIVAAETSSFPALPISLLAVSPSAASIPVHLFGLLLVQHINNDETVG